MIDLFKKNSGVIGVLFSLFEFVFSQSAVIM